MQRNTYYTKFRRVIYGNIQETGSGYLTGVWLEGCPKVYSTTLGLWTCRRQVGVCCSFIWVVCFLSAGNNYFNTQCLGFVATCSKRIHSKFESNRYSVWNARGMRCIRNILWRVISKTTHFKNNSSLSSITILTHSYWDEWICVIMLTIRPKFNTDTVPMK